MNKQKVLITITYVLQSILVFFIARCNFVASYYTILNEKMQLPVYFSGVFIEGVKLLIPMLLVILLSLYRIKLKTKHYIIEIIHIVIAEISYTFSAILLNHFNLLDDYRIYVTQPYRQIYFINALMVLLLNLCFVIVMLSFCFKIKGLVINKQNILLFITYILQVILLPIISTLNISLSRITISQLTTFDDAVHLSYFHSGNLLIPMLFIILLSLLRIKLKTNNSIIEIFYIIAALLSFIISNSYALFELASKFYSKYGNAVFINNIIIILINFCFIAILFAFVIKIRKNNITN